MEGVHLCSVLFFSTDTAAPKKHCKGDAAHFHRDLTGMGGTEPHCTRHLSVLACSLVLMEGFEMLKEFCEIVGPDQEGLCSNFSWLS